METCRLDPPETERLLLAGQRTSRTTGFAEPGRNPRKNRLIALRIGAQRRRVVGVEIPRRDRVDVDAPAGPLARELTGKDSETALRRGVRRHTDAALERQQRRDVDDLAAAALRQHAPAAFGQERSKRFSFDS